MQLNRNNEDPAAKHIINHGPLRPSFNIALMQNDTFFQAFQMPILIDRQFNMIIMIYCVYGKVFHSFGKITAARFMPPQIMLHSSIFVYHVVSCCARKQKYISQETTHSLCRNEQITELKALDGWKTSICSHRYTSVQVCGWLEVKKPAVNTSYHSFSVVFTYRIRSFEIILLFLIYIL